VPLNVSAKASGRRAGDISQTTPNCCAEGEETKSSTSRHTLDRAHIRSEVFS
jgi:hypothetical protein